MIGISRNPVLYYLPDTSEDEIVGSIAIPEKHPAFTIYQEQPLNGAAPLSFIAQEFVTPTDQFFVRNHGTIPTIDPLTFRLTVGGLVRTKLELSLEDLKTRFPQAKVMATLQCAGNRREEMAAVAPIPGEVPWGAEAIGNAIWGGVRLRDVLIAAGIDRRSHHAAFTGLDSVERMGNTFGFGGSIPIEKALMPETLLAYEMNGQPLLPMHGFPLRVVVPGYIGARSVKWLAHVEVRETPSDNYFQQRAYKLFSPDITPDSVDWTKGIMLGENSLNAVICYPSSGDTLPVGGASVVGYAIGDGSNLVERVELSTDGGQTWTRATFLTNNQDSITWRLWEGRVDIQPTTTHIIARAIDSAGNKQPRDTQEIWNFKGYANNAWHKVRIQIG